MAHPVFHVASVWRLPEGGLIFTFAAMCTVVSTDTSNSGDPVDAWRRTMLRVFGAAVEIVSREDDAFRAIARLHAFGSIQLLQLEGTRFLMRCSMVDSASDLFVIVPLRGACIVRTARNEFVMDTRDLVVLQTSGAAEFDFIEAFDFVAVGLNKELVPSIRRTANVDGGVKVPRSSDAAVLAAGIIGAFASNHDEISARSIAKVIDAIVDLLDDAVRRSRGVRSRSNREWLHRERITSVVERELRNPALDIAFIAHSVGLSPRHVHRLFADDSVPLMQWVLELRLENCYRELLHEGPCGRTIGEIAYSWGFNDQAHFSRAFRRRFGTTPSALRSSSPGTTEV